MTNKTAAIATPARSSTSPSRRRRTSSGSSSELAEFVDLFTQHPPLEKVLLNPAVPVPRKRAAVAELTAQAAFTPIVSQAAGAARRSRSTVLLPDLLAAYRERLLEHQQRRARRSHDGDAARRGARRRRSSSGLAQVTGRTVTLATNVDPSIIGGVVARIGSTVYDGSVTRQLEKMRAPGLVQRARTEHDGHQS